MGDTRLGDVRAPEGTLTIVSMQTTHLLAAALVALGLVACSSGTTGSGTGTGTGNGTGNGTGTGNPLLGGGGGTGGGTGFGGLAGTGGGTATCDDACAHYLQCKGEGWDTTQNRSTCVQNCAGLGVTSEQLTSFVALDCQSAIVTIEGNGSSSGGTSGTSSSSGSSGTDCNGCSWDGSACIYLTGSGGNYFACAALCSLLRSLPPASRSGERRQALVVRPPPTQPTPRTRTSKRARATEETSARRAPPIPRMYPRRCPRSSTRGTARP